jgi:hypothetical protein
MGFQVSFPVTIRAPVVAMLMSEGYLPRGYWTRHPRSGLVHRPRSRATYLKKQQVNRLQPEPSWPNLYFKLPPFKDGIIITFQYQSRHVFSLLSLACILSSSTPLPGTRPRGIAVHLVPPFDLSLSRLVSRLPTLLCAHQISLTTSYLGRQAHLAAATIVIGQRYRNAIGTRGEYQ